MNPHEHDRDLIMALAEGSLDARTAAEARQTMTACAECSDELALQEAALAAFSVAPAASLTELEAARFKRDLDTALGHERTVIAPAVQPRRRFNWVPVFSVAAVFLALVLVAPTLSLLGSGDSGDDSAEVVAFDEASEEGAADSTLAPAAVGAPELSRAAENLTASDDAVSTTQAAAAEEDEATAGDGAAAEAASVDEVLTALGEVLDAADDPDDARLKATLFGITPPLLDDNIRCLEEGVEAVVATDDMSYVIGDLALSDVEIRFTAHPIRRVLQLVAHDGLSCAVLAVDGG